MHFNIGCTSVMHFILILFGVYIYPVFRYCFFLCVLCVLLMHLFFFFFFLLFEKGRGVGIGGSYGSVRHF